MSGVPPSSRRRSHSQHGEGSDSGDSDSSSSYSYSSSSRSSSSSSYASTSASDSRSSASSSSSDIRRRRRHGRRRARSLSPSSTGAHSSNGTRKSRMEGILGESDGTVSFVPNALLPSVLGDVAVPTTESVIPTPSEDGVLGAVGRPPGDWPCGVCSNINSQQRDDCYRCGCTYTESLLATPGYEVSVAWLPPTVAVSAAEKALRQSMPEGCVVSIHADPQRRLVYAQFASVEEATKYLVSRRCSLNLAEGTTDENGSSGSGETASCLARLTFALDPHPRRNDADTAAEAARAAEVSSLTAAGVPRFLWPHSWKAPPSFPSVEKQKAFLGTMSTYWEHLSDEQKRYYESEVKKALQQAVSPPEVRTAAVSHPSLTDASSAEEESSTKTTTGGGAASSTAPATGSLPCSQTTAAEESPQKAAGKTSHALDGLKKRLAERKSALKKAEATSAGESSGVSPLAGPSASTPGTTTASASSSSTPSTASTTPAASLKAGHTPGALSRLGSGSSEFPSTPACGLAQMRTWGGFPVPPQYATAAEVPRAVELARVPMSVCERLLPPALLQVARAQFK